MVIHSLLRKVIALITPNMKKMTLSISFWITQKWNFWVVKGSQSRRTTTLNSTHRGNNEKLSLLKKKIILMACQLVQCYFRRKCLRIVVIEHSNDFCKVFSQVFFIWSIDRTLTTTTTPGQCGPGSNGKKGIHYPLQISKTEVSSTGTV